MKYDFKVPLFEFWLHVYIGQDIIPKYKKDVYKAAGPEFKGLRDFQEGKQAGSYLWLDRADLGLLAHELSHFVDDMIRDGGIKDPSGEVKAYFMQWAVPKIWKKIQVK